MKLHLEEANKLARELNDRKMQLKASMFDNKLASFIAFSSKVDVSFGELSFAHIQLPFKKLDITSSELKPVDIRARFNFLLPLEDGERIVAFKCFLNSKDVHKCFTLMSCFDRHGRLIKTEKLPRHIAQRNVVQSAPSEFLVSHCSNYSHELSVYDSDLKCLRIVCCKNFSNICCNSKFVFGLWDESVPSSSSLNRRQPESHADGEENDKYASRRIQVLHLDTLSEAFALRVPKKYTIERMVADEHHLVAMSRPDIESSLHWFVSLFDLATCDSKDSCGKSDCFVVERHVDLSTQMQTLHLGELFLLDGWLVFPGDHEIFWFDKEGNRSETSTQMDNYDLLRDIYSSRSVLLFLFSDGKLLMKR